MNAMQRVVLFLSLYNVTTNAFTPLKGISVTRLNDGGAVDLGEVVSTKEPSSPQLPKFLNFASSPPLPPSPTLLIFGTYAADFNCIEYAQRLNHYLPQFKSKGLGRAILVLNASPDSCLELKNILALDDAIEIFSDPSGAAGRAFGCSRGWLADSDLSPYVKLFGMLLGLGAPMTLPSVISGYLGNPTGSAEWIESSLAQGQMSGRWPDTVLDLDAQGTPTRNAFSALPLVGGWGRRPLELATLRLQNMIGISLEQWSTLQPVDLKVLTQLGGCVLFETSSSPETESDELVRFEWRDPGICAVADFEEILAAL